MIIYRVFFADGGQVDFQIDAVSVNAGWSVAVQKACDCEYDGRRREVNQIVVVR